MAAVINKYKDWIQIVLLLGGIIFIYGKQVESVNDIERRTTQCEEGLKAQNISNSELVKAIYELRGEIKSLNTAISYIKRAK